MRGCEEGNGRGSEAQGEGGEDGRRVGRASGNVLLPLQCTYKGVGIRVHGGRYVGT